ncbi:MAG: hypothetical protein ACHQ1G_09550 [Planctomycetota bacterium]
MNRRKFLGIAAGAGAGAGRAESFQRPPQAPTRAPQGDGLAEELRATDADPADPPAAGAEPREAIEAMGDVGGAYRRAFELGKPLLVFLIPEAKNAKWWRGEIFGALMNHGGAGVLLDLSLCEIVCATVGGIEEQLRPVRIDGEPLMLLVETDRAAPRATPIDPEVRYLMPEAYWGAGRHEETDRLLKERLDTVASALRAAVAPTADVLRARAGLAVARLPAAEAAALLATLARGETPSPEALERGAAIVRAFAEDSAAPQPRLVKSLAGAMAARVKGAPPSGAQWAKTSGCGVRIEGSRKMSSVMCGMGYVPELSQRFLWFFTSKR